MPPVNTASKLHSPRMPPEEENGKPLLNSLLENPENGCHKSELYFCFLEISLTRLNSQIKQCRIDILKSQSGKHWDFLTE